MTASRFRRQLPRLLLLSALPLLTLPRVVGAQTALPPVEEQPALPAQATVTAVNGREVTLDIGTENGARTGAVYTLSRDGLVRAQVQILQARAGESSAVLVEIAEDAVLTVGDVLSFLTVRDLPRNALQLPPVTTPPVAPPTVPETPATSPTPAPNVPAPSGELGADGVPVSPQTPTTPVEPGTGGLPTATAPQGATARVTGVLGTAVTLESDADLSARTGASVSVVRNGNVAAVLRIDSTVGNTATATILFQVDAVNAPVQTGDIVTLPALAVAPGSTLGGPVVDVNETPVVANPVRFESGASNAKVSRADRTYEYLAALAASRLITRYPAHVFHDDGTRFHRTEEDITFTRAQIADLVREALESEGADEPSRRDRLALSALTREFARELRQIGVDADTISNFAPENGFRFGVSGQTRLSLARLQNRSTNVVEPFSERQGGRRTRSGLDVRTNLFGQINDRVSFFATVDSGNDPRRDEDSRQFTLRKAVVSFDANKLLRGLRVEAGRDEYWFGPGRFGTLLLGDTPGGLNSLHTIFQRGSYRIDSVYAPLGQNRALYAKNIQVQLSKQSRIGFAESTLAPSESFQAPQFLATFSPVPIFFAERVANGNNTRRSGNTLIQGYFESSLGNGFSGYGELLIDDIGVNENNQARNRIGTLVGAHLFTPHDPARLGLYVEYANLAFRTYRRFNEDNGPEYDYFYRDRSLGYPVAPTDSDDQTVRGAGAESLRLEAYVRAARRLHLSGGLEFADINSEGPLLARQQVYRFRAAYDLSRQFTLVARVQRVSTTNPPLSSLGVPVARATLAQRLFQLEIARAF